MTQITHDDVLNWGKANGPTAPKPVTTEPPVGSPPTPVWTAQPASPTMGLPSIPQPQYLPYPYAAVQRRTNGLAIASMVLGICWVWWIGSILAIVFGIVALKQIEESNGTQAGRGMAIAGMVLGWVGLIPLGLMILFMVASAASSSGGY